MWVLGQCASRGIRVPQVHALRRVEVESGERSIIVMEKLPGERLRDVALGEVELRRVLEEMGAWLKELHSVPVQGFGYLDGSGRGDLATLDDWHAASLTEQAANPWAAGGSVRFESSAVWRRGERRSAGSVAAPPVARKPGSFLVS